MKKLLLVAFACSSLGACTTTNDDRNTSTWSEARWSEYYARQRGDYVEPPKASLSVKDLNEILAGTAQTTQQMSRDSIAIMNQSAAYKPVEVQSVRQPDGTTWVYCRGVTDTLYHCRTY